MIDAVIDAVLETDRDAVRDVIDAVLEADREPVGMLATRT
jgi:hypothetical protein